MLNARIRTDQTDQQIGGSSLRYRHPECKSIGDSSHSFVVGLMFLRLMGVFVPRGARYGRQRCRLPSFLRFRALHYSGVGLIGILSVSDGSIALRSVGSSICRHLMGISVGQICRQRVDGEFSPYSVGERS